MKKLVTSLTIDNKAVDLFHKLKDGTHIYEYVVQPDHFDADDTKELLFVKNGAVIFTMAISAGCGQNSGYISDVKFLED